MHRAIAASIVLLLGCTEPPPQPGVYRVENLHAQPSEVRVVNEGNSTRFEVTSAGGIGRAAIEIESGTWPASPLVRLHLRDLEGFTASSGARRLDKEDLAITRHTAGDSVYFDVRLPDSLVDGESRIEISWVDFYR